MKKTIEYKNGLVIIEFKENPEAVVFPEEQEHTVSLTVAKLVSGQIISGYKLWDEKPVSLEEGNEAEEIESWLESAEKIGRKFIDVNYQESGSPVRQALISKGFTDQ